jgi:plastocyanin
MPSLVSSRFRLLNACVLRDSIKGYGGNTHYIFIGRVNTWPSQIYPPASFSFTIDSADGTINYIFSSGVDDRTSTDVVGNDPTITIYAGDTIQITNNLGSHPLYIKTVGGVADTNNLVSDPTATGQGAISGSTVSWTPVNTGTFYYQCSLHAAMYGTISVIDRPGEDVAPTPTDSIRENLFSPWREMIAAKKITEVDVSHELDRYDWVSGRVYTEYDDRDSGLFSKQFYVVTRQALTYRVYKCLFNNRGAASTVEPTGTSTSIISTADGYKWKFMYTISAADALKFVTSAYVPVKTLTSDDGSVQWDVQQAASNNSIDIIEVTANGSNYRITSNTFTSVSNTSVVSLANNASQVDSFYNGSSLFVSAGLGSGQIANVISYNGTTRTATLSAGLVITPNTSSSYHIGPKIIISGDGSGAKAYANVASGQITYINMINVGSQYAYANVEISGPGGTGATAVPRLSPPGGHGADPISELGGFNVGINVRISGTEGNTFPTNNDFRIIGLIKDPLLANGSVATGDSYHQTTKLTVVGINSGPYNQDEMVNGLTSGAIGRVVTFANTNADSTNGIVELTNVEGTFTTESLSGNTSSALGTVTSITTPQLRAYSGEVLYRENRAVTSRTVDGIEDIKIVVRF